MNGRSQFDLRLALCFAAVAEERSFTRAAERLGIAQPSVSEQIKRLEEQLGVPLLVRTSRKVQLTPAGTAFLPAAKDVARANEAAQMTALSVRRRTNELLRIGAPAYSVDFEEREALVAEFMTQSPQFSLDIVHAWNSDLISQLRRDEIDLAFVQGEVVMDDLERVLLHRSSAHWLVPEENPLAKLEKIAIQDLRGHSIVSILPQKDEAAFKAYYRRLEESGAILVPTPEHHQRTMELFAKTRRLIHLRYGHGRRKKRIEAGMVRIPSADEPPLIAELFAVRMMQPGSLALERFWRLCKSREVEGDAKKV